MLDVKRKFGVLTLNLALYSSVYISLPSTKCFLSKISKLVILCSLLLAYEEHSYYNSVQREE